jgi:hypothetical protein
MKKVILSGLLIAALLAAGSCKHDASPVYGTQTENGNEKPDDRQGQTETGGNGQGTADGAYFAGVTENLYNRGMWKSTNGQKHAPLDAVDTSAVNSANSVSRYEGRENTHSAKDWYITANNGLTPGLPNK